MRAETLIQSATCRSLKLASMLTLRHPALRFLSGKRVTSEMLMARPRKPRVARLVSMAKNSQYYPSLLIFLLYCPICPQGTEVRLELTFDPSLSFGFEDEISQPRIKGLDPAPGPGEQRSIPPG